jgi:hypothetical protein
MNDNILHVAKTLYMFHEEEPEWNEQMERMWNNLQPKRNYSNPYSVAQDEYIRMAKGIMVLINEELYNNHYKDIPYD